ncbi:DUF421 domain-containing protein [Clostridium ganghwense]|uniref:DUF421 domain-containing protein n=1 Tax=Clostridium ganghwense TaxID=312089 RepID=A0ABT4CN49_9CLOT|nr:DUF421 domain-containing protein [Clostridium ganghwense]MCY6370470.1 DUF421 domain-containing protein [Clostridium ganghwense]
MEIVLFSILRTIIAYAVLLILTRLMGRMIISQITFFDFIIAIVLGSVTRVFVVDSNAPKYSSMVVLITFTILTILINYFDIKSVKFRKIINDKPILVVKNGKIIDRNLCKIPLSINDLLMLLREKDVFDISEVDTALCEYDGKLSVLLKPENQPVTPENLNIKTKYKTLMKDLIIDGEVINKNLLIEHKNIEWLNNKLHTYHIENIKDVFYAGLDSDGDVYVSLKNTKE